MFLDDPPRATLRPAPQGRWYGDACGAALGMELLGERWTVPVLRELLLGGRRFSALRRALPGISARVLTERLAGMEAQSIVARDGPLYALTPWGMAAEPLVLELCRWALAAPHRDVALPLSPVGLVLSMRALLRETEGWRLLVALRVGEESFALRLGDGLLAVARGEVDRPDLGLEAPDTGSFKRFLYGHAPPEALPDLRITGDRAVACRFARLFALPEQAANNHFD